MSCNCSLVFQVSCYVTIVVILFIKPVFVLKDSLSLTFCSYCCQHAKVEAAWLFSKLVTVPWLLTASSLLGFSCLTLFPMFSCLKKKKWNLQAQHLNATTWTSSQRTWFWEHALIDTCIKIQEFFMQCVGMELHVDETASSLWGEMEERKMESKAQRALVTSISKTGREAWFKELFSELASAKNFLKWLRLSFLKVTKDESKLFGIWRLTYIYTGGGWGLVLQYNKKLILYSNNENLLISIS